MNSGGVNREWLVFSRYSTGGMSSLRLAMMGGRGAAWRPSPGERTVSTSRQGRRACLLTARAGVGTRVSSAEPGRR
jgi:hypothetical protein